MPKPSGRRPRKGEMAVYTVKNKAGQELKKVEKEIEKVEKQVKKIPKTNKKKKKKNMMTNFIADALPTVGGILGSQIGGPAGALMGQTIGRMGKKYLSGVEGSGTYRVSDGAASGALVNGATKNVRNIISHEEYLGPVNITTAGITQTVYNVNPANASLFNWLRGQAVYYDRFEFIQLLIKWRSLTPVNTTSNIAYSEIIINNYYDPRETVANNKVELLNRDNVSIFRATDNFDHGFECKVADAMRRKNADPSGVELALYFVENPDNDTVRDAYWLYPGKIALTYSVPTGSVVAGELYIEYKIALSNPKLPTFGTGGSVPTDWFYGSGTSAQVFGTGTNPIYPKTGSSLLGYIDPNTSRYYFPNWLTSGYFMVTFDARVAGSTLTTVWNIGGTNCSTVGIWYNTGSGFDVANSIPVGTAMSIGSVDVLFKITSGGAYLTWSGGTITSSPYWTLLISQVNPAPFVAMANEKHKMRQERMTKFFDDLPEDILLKFHEKIDHIQEVKEIISSKEEEKEDSWLT